MPPTNSPNFMAAYPVGDLSAGAGATPTPPMPLGYDPRMATPVPPGFIPPPTLPPAPMLTPAPMPYGLPPGPYPYASQTGKLIILM